MTYCCEYCGEPFEQSRSDQRFCCPNHRKYSYRDRQRQKAESYEEFPVGDLPLGESFVFLSEVTRQQMRSQFFSIRPAGFSARRWQEIKSGASTYLLLSELDALRSYYDWFSTLLKKGDAPNSRTEAFEKRIVSSRV